MRWPWSKPSPPPRIPPYKVPVQTRPRPGPALGIEVQEHDTSAVDDEAIEALRRAQSETGVHKAWKRLTGQK
jgi:hypothetical protein